MKHRIVQRAIFERGNRNSREGALHGNRASAKELGMDVCNGRCIYAGIYRGALGDGLVASIGRRTMSRCKITAHYNQIGQRDFRLVEPKPSGGLVYYENLGGQRTWMKEISVPQIANRVRWRMGNTCPYHTPSDFISIPQGCSRGCALGPVAENTEPLDTEPLVKSLSTVKEISTLAGTRGRNRHR